MTLGVWENDYNNTITGWRDWIYPEFKGCFAGVRWLQLDTAEGPITVVNNSAVPFVQVLTPEFPPANLAGKAIRAAAALRPGISGRDSAHRQQVQRAGAGGPQGRRRGARRILRRGEFLFRKIAGEMESAIFEAHNTQNLLNY